MREQVGNLLLDSTLGRAKLGDHLNIETDILARTVVHYLHLQGEVESTITLDKLHEAGF